jgi:hypothetical protein
VLLAVVPMESHEFFLKKFLEDFDHIQKVRPDLVGTINNFFYIKSRVKKLILEKIIFTYKINSKLIQ